MRRNPLSRPSTAAACSSHRLFSRSRRLFCAGALCAGTLLVPLAAELHADDTWTGGGSATNSNWSNASNWNNGIPSSANYGTLIFATATGSPSNDDITGLSENKLLDTAGAFTINGTGDISLYDNGGTQAKIENNGTAGLFTLNMATLNFAATSGAAWGEINAVTGDITFGTANTLNVNGSQVAGIRMFGGTGRTTTFNNTVNATGKYFDTASTSAQIVTTTGTFTSGDFYLMNGSTLNNSSAASGFAAANLRLGGDFATSGNQNLASGATFNLTVLTGGQTFAGGINTVSGNTSGALIINSQNTSGTNTLSGNFFLDSNLRVNQSANTGALLLGAASSTNTISFQSAGSRVLTLNAGGGAASTITVNEAFTNVLDGSDVLVTLGNGVTATTTINGNNSAAGSNLLLFNVQSGSLGISSANNLGSPVVSGNGYPDKVLFGTATSSTTGTLQINGSFAYGSATAGSLLGFAINKSSGTNIGRINVTGTNTFVMNGALSDFGSGANAGNWEFNNGTGATSTGTITLNAASSYAGTSTLAGGLLNLGNANAISTGALIFAGAASFDNTSGAAMTLTNALTLSGGSPTFVGTNNLTINGPVTISGGTRTITVTANTLTLNGNIGQDASARALAKAGAGTLTLNGTSNFTGGLTLTAGTLNLNNAAALGTGTFTINGGTLDTTTGAAITVSTNPAITFGNNFTFGGSNSLNLGTGAVSDGGDRTITLNSNNTNTLTFGGTLINTAATAKTLNVNNATGVSGETVVFNGFTLATASTANVLYVINASGNLVFNGPITNGTGTGANGFSFTGGTTGSLTLSGTNTYTGVTTLNSGTLNLNSTGALGSGAFTIGGGTINNTSGAAIAGQTNNPAINFNNGFAFGGSNSLNLGTGAVTIASDRTVTLNGNNTNTLTFGGVMNNTRANTGVNIAVNNATGVSGETLVFTDFNLATNSTAAVTDIISGNGNITFNGTVANGNANANPLNITNTGLVTFAGTNTYTGATTIQGAAGTVRLTGTLGSGGGTAITVANTATLTETSSGVIAGASSLTVNASGATATLGGVNTYTGTTALSAGTLNVNNAGALGSGTFTVSGGTLDNTSGAAITSQTNSPAIVIGNSFAFGGSNSLNVGNGTVSVAGDRTITLNSSNNMLTFGGTLQNTNNNAGFNITVNNGTGATGGSVVFNNGFNMQASAGTASVNNIISGTGNTVINGTIANGGAGNNSLSKQGTGILTVTGANTYSGNTTVSGGTFLVNNTSGSGTGTGTVAVNGAGTVLGGIGSFTGAVTIGDGTTASNIAPGAALTTTGIGNGTATLSTGALTLALNSNYRVDLNGNLAGATYDQLNVRGTVTLAGNLVINNNYTPASGDVFVLILNDGTDAVTGVFATNSGVPTGYTIDYTYDAATGATVGGNDVALIGVTPVPEPATCFGGLALLGVAGWHGRRHWLRKNKSRLAQAA